MTALSPAESVFAREFAGNPDLPHDNRLLVALFSAGYKPVVGVTPDEAATKIYDKPEVQAAITRHSQLPARPRTEPQRTDLIELALNIHDLCLLDDKWMPGVAGQMVTLIAKLQGMLVEKHEVSTMIKVEELTDAELLRVIQLAERKMKLIDVTPEKVGT